jgi:hypothetical protein
MPNQDERPATKHDLDQLEGSLVEATRDIQTEVLRAFHNWARPAQKSDYVPTRNGSRCSKHESAKSSAARDVR